MLGIFDSGFGGYQTLKYLQKQFPDLDYIFYADNANVPYGNKNPKEIEELTFKGINFLFDNGAKLVILACNTASSYSIKKWQKMYPKKKVLSITIPAVEKIIGKKYKKVGLFATYATIYSDIYSRKYFELTDDFIDFYQVPTPKLVDLIENRVEDEEIINNVIKSYIDQLPNDIEALVLGCTHYPIYLQYFQKYFTKDIIDPGQESVKKLVEYFRKHNDIYDGISKNGEIKIIETGKEKKISK